MPVLIFHLESYTLCGEIQKEGKHSVILCKILIETLVKLNLFYNFKPQIVYLLHVF